MIETTHTVTTFSVFAGMCYWIWEYGLKTIDSMQPGELVAGVVLATLVISFILSKKVK